MVWVGVLIVVASWVLVAVGMVAWWVPFLVTSAAAVLGALWLDRTGRGNRASARLDANRPDYYAPMGNATWQVPTSYIDHPTGTGPPPGVERYDEDAVDVLTGATRSPQSQSEDLAP